MNMITISDPTMDNQRRQTRKKLRELNQEIDRNAKLIDTLIGILIAVGLAFLLSIRSAYIYEQLAIEQEQVANAAIARCDAVIAAHADDTELLEKYHEAMISACGYDPVRQNPETDTSRGDHAAAAVIINVGGDECQ